MEIETLIRITADDAGLDAEQDARLLQLARSSALTGISFFVNMSSPPPSAPDFLGIPGLSVGLHLDLTDGRPVAKAGRVPTLLADDGSFHNARQLMKRCLTGAIQPAELVREVDAQIQCFIERFGRIDHIDTHRHVHRIPHVARAIAGALSSRRLSPRIRNLNRCVVASGSGRSFSGRLRYWLDDLKRVPGWFLKRHALRAFAVAGLPMEDGLLTPWPAIAPDDPDAAARWARAIQSAPAGRWEANFHPGWNAAEAALLQDPEFVAGRSLFSHKNAKAQR
jgi:hypothetical protein